MIVTTGLGIDSKVIKKITPWIKILIWGVISWDEHFRNVKWWNKRRKCGCIAGVWLGAVRDCGSVNEYYCCDLCLCRIFFSVFLFNFKVIVCAVIIENLVTSLSNEVTVFVHLCSLAHAITPSLSVPSVSLSSLSVPKFANGFSGWSSLIIYIWFWNIIWFRIFWFGNSKLHNDILLAKVIALLTIISQIARYCYSLRKFSWQKNRPIYGLYDEYFIVGL